MRSIKKGDIITLKPEYLAPGEANPPHVAIEDDFDGAVRVEAVGPSSLRFKPINEWRVEWIAE